MLRSFWESIWTYVQIRNTLIFTLNFDGLELILNFSSRVTQSSMPKKLYRKVICFPIVDRFRCFANEREKRISQL